MSQSLWALTLVKLIKFFYINICCFCRKTLPNLASLSHSVAKIDQNNLIQYGRRRHVEFTSGLHFNILSRLGRQNASTYQILCKSVYDVSYIFKMASIRRTVLLMFSFSHFVSFRQFSGSEVRQCAIGQKVQAKSHRR